MAISKTKKCTKCKKEKSFNEFHKNNRSKDGLHTRCKVCKNLQNLKWVCRSKEKRALQFQKWYSNPQNRKDYAKKQAKAYQDNKEYMQLRCRCWKAGITVKIYNELFGNHNGFCDICGIHQKDVDKTFSIDHDHVTGKIRGLLCQNCNWMLGHGRDNLDILIAAYAYLKESKESEAVA